MSVSKSDWRNCSIKRREYEVRGWFEMNIDFLSWLEEHKEEYGVKIIENPTEEQVKQCKEMCQEVLDWIKEMKKYAIREE